MQSAAGAARGFGRNIRDEIRAEAILGFPKAARLLWDQAQRAATKGAWKVARSLAQKAWDYATKNASGKPMSYHSGPRGRNITLYGYRPTQVRAAPPRKPTAGDLVPYWGQTRGQRIRGGWIPGGSLSASKMGSNQRVFGYPTNYPRRSIPQRPILGGPQYKKLGVSPFKGRLSTHTRGRPSVVSRRPAQRVLYTGANYLFAPFDAPARRSYYQYSPKRYRRRHRR